MAPPVSAPWRTWGPSCFKAVQVCRPCTCLTPATRKSSPACWVAQIQFSLLPPGLAMPQVRAGKLHAIGVTSAGRSSLVPDVPSLAEAGLAGFQLEIWNAVAAPASMPAVHIQKVSAALVDIVRRPDMRQKLFNQGWQVAGTSPEGLANRIKTDTAQMADVIRAQGIKAQ